MAEVTDTVKAFFSAYTLRRAKPGEIVIQAGDDPAGIFYIESGRFRKYDISDHGSEMVINTFKEGAFFPMSWALNKEHNEYFYEALAESSYRIAPPEAVVAFLTEHPDVSLDLLSRVFRGADGLSRRMACMVGSNAHRRALFELYIYCRRFGATNDEGHCTIAIHEGEIAKAAGLSRETFSRELQPLKKTGRIDISRKGITVTDMSWLEKELDIS